MNRIIETIYDGDEIKEVDITPVRDFMDYVNESLKHINNIGKIRGHEEYNVIKAMDYEQLFRLSLALLNEIRSLQRLYLHSYTDEHQEHVKVIKNLNKLSEDAGYSKIWDEIPK